MRRLRRKVRPKGIVMFAAVDHDKLAANNVVLPASFFSADDSDQVRASFAATGFPGAYE